MEKTCPKKIFETMQEASKRASEITFKNKSKGDKTKLRAYKCEHCEKYHLTSLTKYKYRIKTDKNYRQKVKEENFIKRETEYWEKKFGIE